MLRLAASAHPLRAGPTALARLSGLRFCSSDARKNEVAEAIDDKSTFETFTGARVVPGGVEVDGGVEGESGGCALEP